MSKETTLGWCGLGVTIILGILQKVVRTIPMGYVILGYVLGGGLIVYGIVSYFRFKGSYIEFPNQWNVRRITDDKIRIDGEIRINSPIVICTGTLTINKVTIKLARMILAFEHIAPGGLFFLILDGEYKGTHIGQGLLKLKVVLGDRTSKKFKQKINISIPDKVDSGIKLPNPADIANIFGHKPDYGS